VPVVQAANLPIVQILNFVRREFQLPSFAWACTLADAAVHADGACRTTAPVALS
jgi:hypothetical protein